MVLSIMSITGMRCMYLILATLTLNNASHSMQDTTTHHNDNTYNKSNHSNRQHYRRKTATRNKMASNSYSHTTNHDNHHRIHVVNSQIRNIYS